MRELHPTLERNTCNLCSKQFTKISSLKQHMLIHTGEEPFSCSVCERTFVVKTNLKRHILTHTKDKREKRTYQCSWCLKSFAQNSTLAQHALTHSGEKPFTCQVCQRTFSVKSNLKKHLLIHTGEKPHVCEVCRETFTHKVSLTAHMTKHIGTNFRCEFCNSTFTRKFNLKNHMRRHTGELPYLCVVCMQCFAQRSQLTAHLGRHAEEARLQCNSTEVESSSVEHLNNKHDTGIVEPDGTTVVHSKKLFDDESNTNDMDDYENNVESKIIDQKLIGKKGVQLQTHNNSWLVWDSVEKLTACKLEISEIAQHSDGLNIQDCLGDQSEKTDNSEKVVDNVIFKRSPNSSSRYDSFTVDYLSQYVMKTEKLHTCEVCQKSFRRSGNLTAHQRIHTGERRFKCGICAKSYSSRYNLERHIESHCNKLGRHSLPKHI